jgi:hypothetical protein
MIKALHDILDERCFIMGIDFNALVGVLNISLKDKKFPNLNREIAPMIILGGSEANASDENGKRFTDNVCIPLLEEIESCSIKKVLAICFGSQAVLQAYGRIKNVPISTMPGALQFGAFPAAFDESQKDILQELSGGMYTVGLTHGWYSDCSGKRPSDMRPIAFEAGLLNGKLKPFHGLPPLGFSLFDGKVITTQFHPELQLSGKDENNQIAEWMEQNYGIIDRWYDAPASNSGRSLFEKHFKPRGKSKNGVVPWIKKDVGPVFILNTLLKQARECVKYCPKEWTT